MWIDFSSSGGIVNLPLNYQVETNELPEKQAKELATLVKSADAFNLPESELSPSAASTLPDVIVYRLSLSEGNQQRTFWFNDVTAPAAIRPLLARLRELALEQRRKRNR